MKQNRSNSPLTVALGALLVTGLAASPLAFAQDHATGKAADQRDSEQPVGDTWITTKVKADLLATSDVPGTSISVETVNGVVTLSGDVESQAQINRAVEVARKIKGVTNVDSSKLRVAGR